MTNILLGIIALELLAIFKAGQTGREGQRE